MYKTRAVVSAPALGLPCGASSHTGREMGESPPQPLPVRRQLPPPPSPRILLPVDSKTPDLSVTTEHRRRRRRWDL